MTKSSLRTLVVLVLGLAGIWLAIVFAFGEVEATGSDTITGSESMGEAIPRRFLPIMMIPEPTSTPTPTDTAEPTATFTPSPTPTPLPTGLARPKSVAANPKTGDIYVTSRDNNRVFMLDGTTLAEIMHADVGRAPWPIAVNPATNKVYVAHFDSGDVYVLDATTLAQLRIIPVGRKLTALKIDQARNRVYVVTYGSSALGVIDGNTDSLQTVVTSGGLAAWGLAFNPTLNRIYISNRDSGTVTSLDANNNYQVIPQETIKPCGGAGSSPYGMDFNPINSKLYIACSPYQNVNRAAIYTAKTGRLAPIAFVAIGQGGVDGGGGVAVDLATGNVFFSNSISDDVSVISGTSDSVIATIPVGLNPFGIGVNANIKQVYVANRESNSVSAFADTFGP